jgi:signal transduction histidine kinase/AraC-like DNA-binding protein/ABC-type sugar transport system substrate-binding protein
MGSQAKALRVGLTLTVTDPFWVEVRESIYKSAQQLGIELIHLNVEPLHTLPINKQAEAFDELGSQDLVALIDFGLPQALLISLLDRGMPVISLREREFHHPNLFCPIGLREGAELQGQFLLRNLKPPAEILVVGGVVVSENRLAGLKSVLEGFPDIHLHPVIKEWGYGEACAAIRSSGLHFKRPLDAIVGLSDPLALAGRDTARELGWIDPHTLVVGLNGDALALAAIAEGSMAATVETNATDFGQSAVTLTWELIQNKRANLTYHFHPRLVTKENVHEVAFRKLLQIADIPSRLAGVNLRREQQRLEQLETSLALHRQVGTILDRRQLLRQMKEVLRDNLDYDQVHYYQWSPGEDALFYEDDTGARQLVSWDELVPARDAIREDQVVFIPDVSNSVRYPPDARFPQSMSRVVVPIHLGEQVTGLLDLHSYRTRAHTLEELRGLQSLANQLGITLQNAELYGQAREAQARAEQADRLKTRLLANVSHELRTPLNLILGYSQSVLRVPNPYQQDLPAELLRDIGRVYQSGEHLLRLINDLLDLSRAEVDLLELYPELIQPRAFLEAVFQDFRSALDPAATVEWILEVPENLPAISADPLRLRQICINLLSNASKFTHSGMILLGAEVSPPHLHFWVEDTGPGIPPEVQEKIFEPFVTSGREMGVEGIGLGLTITRRLVALHYGSMSLESQPGQGSVFHVYLPLPSLEGIVPLSLSAEQPVMVLISPEEETWPEIREICARKELQVQHITNQESLDRLIEKGRPAGIAWNISHASAGDWQLIERFRAHPLLAQLPFLFFAGDVRAQIDQPRPSGVTGVLLKPVPAKELLEMIRSFQTGQLAGPIMVVDDDPETRRFYNELLKSAFPARRVVECSGGEAALAALEQVTPVLILLDLMMPDLDGFSVLRFIRARPATQLIPVLVLSGKVLSRQEIEQLDDAYTVFQNKGILTQAELAEQVQQAFNPDERLPQQTSSLVKQAVAYIQNNYNQPVAREDIASAIGVNKDYLSRIFAQELGISPWDFLTRYRVNRALELLLTSSSSITQIGLQVGFNDSAYFSRVFQKQVGCSPRDYRKKAGPRS